MVNRERLADTFIRLIRIDSVSREEGRLAAELKRTLEQMGAETFIDDAGNMTGSDTGNLIARFKGTLPVPPLLLNAHMDTVEPGRGIKVILENGRFTSDGTTILGADDKSAIAVIIETLQGLHERNAAFGPIEVVLTICEEIGLQGAKHFDFSRITATCGYALDATDTRGIITAAPGANRLELVVHGKDAHAGASPEKGINAIYIAGCAIAGLKIGRIDHETTANIGIIEGGIATNIVPNRVTVKGEVRSHDDSKLKQETEGFISAFETVVKANRKQDVDTELPRLDVRVERDFSPTLISESHPIVTLACRAAQRLGRPMRCKTTGGGADANIFFEKGIVLGVIGTGMQDMHTVRESVGLEDMAEAVDLLNEIIMLHAEDHRKD